MFTSTCLHVWQRGIFFGHLVRSASSHQHSVPRHRLKHILRFLLLVQLSETHCLNTFEIQTIAEDIFVLAVLETARVVVIQSRSPLWYSLIWYSPCTLAPNWSTHWIQTCRIDVQHYQLLSTCLSTFSAQLSQSHTFSVFCQHQSAVISTCPYNLCLTRF